MSSLSVRVIVPESLGGGFFEISCPSSSSCEAIKLHTLPQIHERNGGGDEPLSTNYRLSITEYVPLHPCSLVHILRSSYQQTNAHGTSILAEKCSHLLTLAWMMTLL
jgi:hypothetical protein